MNHTNKFSYLGLSGCGTPKSLIQTQLEDENKQLKKELTEAKKKLEIIQAENRCYVMALALIGRKVCKQTGIIAPYEMKTKEPTNDTK